jgi:hypothetical protein
MTRRERTGAKYHQELTNFLPLNTDFASFKPQNLPAKFERLTNECVVTIMVTRWGRYDPD